MSLDDAAAPSLPRLGFHETIDALLDELAGLDGVRGAIVSEEDGCAGDGAQSGLDHEHAMELGACVQRLVEAATEDEEGAELPDRLRDLSISFGHAELIILPGPLQRHLALVVERPGLAVFLRARLGESWPEIEGLLIADSDSDLDDEEEEAANDGHPAMPVPAAFVDETASRVAEQDSMAELIGAELFESDIPDESGEVAVDEAAVRAEAEALTEALGKAEAEAAARAEADAQARAEQEELARAEAAAHAEALARAEAAARAIEEEAAKAEAEAAAMAEAARRAEEQRRAEELRKAEELLRVEALRKAEEQRQAEEIRRAEEAARAEAARKAEAARQADELRRAEAAARAAEIRKAEAAVRAEEIRKAEAAARAAEIRRAEAAARAAEIRRAEAEARAEEIRRAEAEAKAEEIRNARASARRAPAAAAPAESKFEELDPSVLGDPDSEYGGVMRGPLGPVLVRVRQAFTGVAGGSQAAELGEQFKAEVEDWLLVTSATPYSFPLLVDALSEGARLAGDAAGEFSTAVQAIMRDSKLWSRANQGG